MTQSAGTWPASAPRPPSTARQARFYNIQNAPRGALAQCTASVFEPNAKSTLMGKNIPLHLACSPDEASKSGERGIGANENGPAFCEWSLAAASQFLCLTLKVQM